jgi:TRAP-type C4-dicarboxylate transport system permease small subunit
LVDRLGKKLQNRIETLVVFIVSGFLIIFIWKAAEYTIGMAKQVSPSIQMSMAVPYSSVVVGGILMLYYVLRNWWFDIHKKNKGDNPLH